MKKYVAIGIVACGLLIALGGFLPVRYDSPYDVEGFARLPILTGGRPGPSPVMLISPLMPWR